MLFERVELHGLAAELDREALRRLVSPVRHEHARRARRREVLRREFGHLARAQEQDGRPFQRAENLPAQLDGRVAYRDRRGRYPGLVADALRDVKRLMYELVKDFARRPRFDRERVSVAHLT